jgi:hypothetical protein
MKFSLSFYSKAPPGSLPNCLSNPPPADFGTLGDARRTAYSSANALGANSILIESEDEKISERWVRDGGKWTREDA